MLPPAQKAPTINTVSHSLPCQPQACLGCRRVLAAVAPKEARKWPGPSSLHKQMSPRKFNVILLKLQHLHSTGSTAKNREREEPPALSREDSVWGQESTPARTRKAAPSRQGRRIMGEISTWDVSLQPWKRERGRRMVRMEGRQLHHPDIHTLTPQKVGGSQQGPCS